MKDRRGGHEHEKYFGAYENRQDRLTTLPCSQYPSMGAEDMTDISEVRYARSSGDIDIAYQTVGHGPIDLVFVSGFTSHLDLNWEFPWYSWPVLLDGIARVIMFDKRGTGLSDRSLGFGSLADRADDVRAVMDATGVERAVLYGVSEGGPMAIVFAATYPQRVSKLMLYGTFARAKYAPDYPMGLSDEACEELVRFMGDNWGTGKAFGLVVQNAPDPEKAQQALARFERNACTRQMVVEIMRRNNEIDIRQLLPAISIPTLVMHNGDDPLIPVAVGRYLAEHIPGAQFVEGPGNFHATWNLAEMQWVAEAMFEFLGAPPVEREPDRILATFGGPARGIDCARAIRQSMRPLGLDIRAGLHTGEVELRGDDIGGIGVHIGARVAALAPAGEVWVSRTVKGLGRGVRDHVRGQGYAHSEGCHG